MRKPTFEIRKVKIAGKTFYQVRIPSPDGGPSKRKTFAEESAAETFVSGAKKERENYGNAAFSITDTLRTDAVRAAELLEETGATLTEAARFFLADFRLRNRGVPIRQAVDEFLATRAGREKRHLANLKTRLNFFAAAAEGKTTAEIKTEEISGFLAGLEFEPRTIHHYWTHLNGLFRFCVSRQYAAENPMRLVDAPRVVDGDIEILSPEEAGKLLAACDDRIRAGVVIALFCGLRQSEIERLDWQAVEIPDDGSAAIIRLSASQVKTAARRVVPIPECAVAWLLPLRQKSGKVWEEGGSTRDLWTKARILAGFGPFKPTSAEAAKLQTDPKTKKPRKNLKPWPANALRHSAISYKLAQSPDLARLSYESGNSPDVIRKHYNGLATAKQAATFFALLPPTQEKIVRMSA